jgi:hypothetical protein
MVALEIKKSDVIQAILSDPDSDMRQMARDALAKTPTLRELLEAIGFVKTLSAVDLYELDQIVLAHMEPEVEVAILTTLMFAFQAELPIIFDWVQREASCLATMNVVGGKVFLTVGTPMLDVTKIRPGTFAGAMASF